MYDFGTLNIHLLTQKDVIKSIIKWTFKGAQV